MKPIISTELFTSVTLIMGLYRLTKVQGALDSSPKRLLPRNCNLKSQIRTEFPTLKLNIPTNTTELWFSNDTFRLLQNMDLNLNLSCEAGYPIQWVEYYDKDSDGLGGLSQQNLEKGLWNEVVWVEVEDDYAMGQGEWLYRSVFTLKFPGSVASISNFSCQAVTNPCIQSNVIPALNQSRDLVSIHLSHELQPDIRELEVKGSCEAIVSYWLHPMKHTYGWKCETSNGKIITDRNEFLICDSAAHCNTFYQHQRMGTLCLRMVAECYFYCGYIAEHGYKPGFLTCRDQGVLLAQHYFYSVPQVINETPEIYFDWSEADPQKMLVIEGVSNETYLGDNITVFCQISRYYFAYGHRFGVDNENGSIKYEEATDGEVVSKYNTNRINVTIELTKVGSITVYCLAPVWNSTVWINQSLVIEVLPDPEPPTFTDTDTDQEEDTIFWYTGDTNKTVSCSAVGKPTPTVAWSLNSIRPGSKVAETFSKTPITELEFPEVDQDSEGSYVCEAENYLGVSRKIFRVVVIDRFKLMVKRVSIGVSVILASCLIIMVLCWKTIQRQRKEIRLLSEAEVKEFLEGNVEVFAKNDYLDTADLIQSLPYNPKYEIPKEMIHIDQSNVLGSGNFGQVLKGSIQLLENQDGNRSSKRALKGMNSIEVAVKTVKHNMEVLYFKTLLSEVKIMAHIGKHPNICSLVGACTQNIRKREIFIAVEFCINGSLEHFLRKRKSTFVNLVKDDFILPPPPSSEHKPYENVDNEEDGANQRITTQNLIKWSREIANGMEFLGSKKIIHGDLAARNVFLSDELVVKIGDFGLSRQLMEYSNYVKSQEFALPWKWISIESLQDMKFSVFSDIWAYGITIWEIFTLGNVPYPGVAWSADFLDQLANGMRMHKPSFATTKIYNTMLDCWNVEPSRRPSFTDLKIFFERILVDNTPQVYFQPTLDGFAGRVSTSTSTSTLPQTFGTSAAAPGLGRDPGVNHPATADNNLSPDSGIAEDTHGYLVPLIE